MIRSILENQEPGSDVGCEESFDLRDEKSGKEFRVCKRICLGRQWERGKAVHDVGNEKPGNVSVNNQEIFE